MDNPLLATVLEKFPDVVASSLPWPPDANDWDVKSLEMFVASGGFLKPKKKAGPAKAAPAPLKAPPSGPTPAVAAPALAAPAMPAEEGYAAEGAAQAPVPAPAPAAAADALAPMASGEKGRREGLAFEEAIWCDAEKAFMLLVRVHCEDTAPHQVAHIFSLVQWSERVRSLAMKQIMHVSLDDIKRQSLAILATEYLVEIKGKDVGVMHTLRVETALDFPGCPVTPWDMKMYAEDGSLYATGLFALNLCSINQKGEYAGVTEDKYQSHWSQFQGFKRSSESFSSTKLRLYYGVLAQGAPFRPTKKHVGSYTVKSTDCDMYNVLFQARVPAMMESVHARGEAVSYYVNIRNSLRPGDQLEVHVFSTEDAALFVCIKDGVAALAAFGKFGTRRPVYQEEMKCGSFRIAMLIRYITQGSKPPPNDDLDLSDI